MLAPEATPQLRRICRRIGYWHIPSDQGQSIKYTSRVGGAYFWSTGAAQNSPGAKCARLALPDARPLPETGHETPWAALSAPGATGRPAIARHHPEILSRPEVFN